MPMPHAVICGLPRFVIFFHIIAQTTRIKKKKVIEHKTCVLIVYTTVVLIVYTTVVLIVYTAVVLIVYTTVVLNISHYKNK
jgi:hypothetical protein